MIHLLEIQKNTLHLVLIEKEEECEWIEKNMYPVTAYLMPYIYVCFIRHMYSSLFNKNKVLITNLKDL